MIVAALLSGVRDGDDEVWRRRSNNLVDRLLALFHVFNERLVEMGAHGVCKCTACAAVGRLQLKVIGHSGDALLSHVGDHLTL